MLQGLNAVELLHDAEREEGYTPTPYSAYQIAPVIGASNSITERTMYLLAKADIVTVKRGPGGGFGITEHQLQIRRVRDVLEALGQRMIAPEGSRASDRVQQAAYDAVDVTLEEFLK